MSFTESLAFVLYVGAARSAATPVQRDALRARVIPALGIYRATGNEGPVRAVIRDVMGATWEPDAEWKTMIDKLTRRT